MNDEELWSRYFITALELRLVDETIPTVLGSRVNGAAVSADAMLEKHRERFPSPPKEGPFR